MKQTIHIAVDAAELVDSLQWDVLRKEIEHTGARGMAGNDGLLTLRMNGQPVLHIQILEDQQGKVVVDVLNRAARPIGRVYPEDDGVVPARIVKERTS